MRVLIIDDSVVSRRLIGDALSSAADIQVMTASSGKTGLAKIAQQQPDLVTLDVEMPDLNGIETLKLIRRDYPRLPVIMVSRLTEQGASTTIDALFFGADDYATKPEAQTGIEQAIVTLRKQLLPKIRALYSADKQDKRADQANKLVTAASGNVSGRSVKIVAIGSSTGGPNALAELFKGLTQQLNIPIVIAQHTLPVFSKHIASRLSDKTGLFIQEGSDGVRINSQGIWLAPGNQHMSLMRNNAYVQLAITESQGDEPTPSVDHLFNSAASLYGAGVLAVVLTGMGRDGLLGCQKIREQGGQIIVQDQSTSVVWGMPGAVANAGLADEILPLEQIAGSIMKRIKN